MQVPSSDGVTVAVHDLGGSGEPLVIAHATGFCGRAYEPLAAELAGDFHVWALDYRAHGDSTAPDGDRFDWAGMADDLEAAVAAITSEPVALFGHSMGGATAMLLERRRPGSLRWAYLFEPIVVPPGTFATPGTNPMAAAAARRRPGFASRGDAMVRYASRPTLNVLRADALLAYVEHGFRDEPDGTIALKLAPAHEAATFDAPGKPTVEQLADVGVPVTIARGARSGGGWSPADLSADQVAALPHGRLDEYPALGHFGPLQDPAVVARGVLASSGG